MNQIAKVIGRIIAILVDRGVIERKDAVWILEPLKESEPKKGQWVKTPKAVMGEGYMWFCDKCKHQVYQDSSRPYPDEKFCPNCGAKMTEREKKQ